VIDSGPGIKESHLEAINLAFVQRKLKVKPSHQPLKQATGEMIGFGLSSVIIFLELLGGKLQVTSMPWFKTEVTFDIPLQLQSRPLCPLRDLQPLPTLIAPAPANRQIIEAQVLTGRRLSVSERQNDGSKSQSAIKMHELEPNSMDLDDLQDCPNLERDSVCHLPEKPPDINPKQHLNHNQRQSQSIANDSVVNISQVGFEPLEDKGAPSFAIPYFMSFNESQNFLNVSQQDEQFSGLVQTCKSPATE